MKLPVILKPGGSAEDFRRRQSATPQGLSHPRRLRRTLSPNTKRQPRWLAASTLLSVACLTAPFLPVSLPTEPASGDMCEGFVYVESLNPKLLNSCYLHSLDFPFQVCIE